MRAGEYVVLVVQHFVVLLEKKEGVGEAREVRSTEWLQS